jgi:hypothetical protein
LETFFQLRQLPDAHVNYELVKLGQSVDGFDIFFKCIDDKPCYLLYRFHLIRII